MTREVLSNGVIVPEKYTRDWFDDFRTNLVKLNDAITAIAGKQNALTQEQLDAVNSAITSQKVTAYDDHIADTSKHLTDGTASKAIADEDGTSIKSGYVNVAGTQTVTGQKTWNANQFFTAIAYHRNNSYEIGNTPASNIAIPIYFTDKNNIYTGYVRNVVLATGRTQSELLARNKFTNGTLSPTGTDISSTLVVEVQSDGTKSLYFDGSIRNNVLPYTTNAYSLGSSSYQWSSVYAQSYYYNGTQWGLDKTNVWSGTNTYTKTVTLYNSDDTQSVPALYLRNSKAELSSSGNTSSYQDISFRDKNDTNYAYIRSGIHSNGSIINLKTFAKDSNNNPVENTLQIISFINGTKALLPVNSGTDLGNSNYKWKTLNGINPGALSLPDYDETKAIIVDTTGWTYDGSTANQLKINNATQTINGWLFIRIENVASTDRVIIRFNGNLASDPAMGFSPAGTGINLIMPIPANKITNIYLTKSPLHIKFYPCLGNV